MEIFQQAFGPLDEDVATCLNNLAVVYSDQGRYDEAEPLLQRALETYRKLFGAKHLDVAMGLLNLADLCRQRKRYEQAKDYGQQALAMYQAILGPQHPDTALALLALAELYRDEGQPEREAEAARLYQQSLAAAEKSLGPEHPGLVLALNGLAKLYEKQGQHQKGESLLDRAIAIHGHSGGAAAERCESYLLRARLAWKQDRRQEALADLRQAMQLAEQQRARISGAERERAMAFAEFGEVFEQMVAWQVELGNPNEALEAMERSAPDRCWTNSTTPAPTWRRVDLAPNESRRGRGRPSSGSASRRCADNSSSFPARPMAPPLTGRPRNG